MAKDAEQQHLYLRSTNQATEESIIRSSLSSSQRVSRPASPRNVSKGRIVDPSPALEMNVVPKFGTLDVLLSPTLLFPSAVEISANEKVLYVTAEAVGGPPY
ncbi:MAG: hypothetical protein KC766_17630, partial [Myxococcales bacterium]|nr:hypothetical protein [Myxococcales bacterium]